MPSKLPGCRWSAAAQERARRWSAAPTTSVGTIQRQQPAEHPQDASIRHGRRHGAAGRIVLPLQEGEDRGVEQLAAAAADPARGMAAMDQTVQREQLRPGATPLIHSVGMAGLIVQQTRVQGAHTIALVIERPRLGIGDRGHQVAILGVEQEDQPQQDRQQPLIEIRRPLRREPPETVGVLFGVGACLRRVRAPGYGHQQRRLPFGFGYAASSAYSEIYPGTPDLERVGY